jgi:type I restriction enzyme, S subunit
MGWENKRFGDCALLVRDTVQPSDAHDLPYVGLEHISQGTLSLIGYGKSNDVISIKAKFREGDILFGKLRPYFRKVIIAPFDGVCSTDIWVVRAKTGTDQKYLFYWMASNQFIEASTRASEGTKMPRAKWDYVEQIIHILPPENEQQAIAGVLGALDDKIELNRRMNRTLEAIARSTFLKWFIENEKVETWPIGKIADIADVIDCLHSKKPERQESGKPFLQLSNILDDGLLDISDAYYITQEDYDFWISRIEARPGDCVITNVGRVGAVAQIPDGFKAALGRNMTAIRCKKEYPYPTFLIECLLSDSLRKEINNKTDTGTILDALNVKNIPLLQFAIPPHSLFLNFEKTVRPIRAKMEQNLKESQTLARLRDTLLPKLMRGEVRMKV